MATNFPGALDDFQNPGPKTSQAKGPRTHSQQHSDLNDAVEALQAKIGANNSSAPSSFDFIIRKRLLTPHAFGAVGNGVANDTAGISAWLQALNAEKLTGYIPAGDYLVDGFALYGRTDIHVEAHSDARIIGRKSYQNFAGSGVVGQQFTVTDFGVTYGEILATRRTAAGLDVALVKGTDYSVSGSVITLLGATTIPVGDTLRAVASESLIEIGGSAFNTGSFSWEGGHFDTNERGMIPAAASGTALTIMNYGKYEVHGVHFYAAEDYEAAIAKGVGDSGLVTFAQRGNVSACLFQGHPDLGTYVTGGGDVGSSDNPIGHVFSGNHYVKCAVGWKASRDARNVKANGNEYDRCGIGAALWSTGTASPGAGRGSITGEIFRRCGGAIDAREQVGAVFSDNTIIDPCYALDGVTSATSILFGWARAINLDGCASCRATDNTIVMDELPINADSRGIYSRVSSVDATKLPKNNVIENNTLNGMNIGIFQQDDGGGNRYRNNDFFNCPTHYSGVPAASLAAGSYTPTLINQANISASSITNPWRWYRVENMIHVYGSVNLTPTAGAVVAELRASLPVATNIALAANLGGGTVSDGIEQHGKIYGPVDEGMRFQYTAFASGSRAFGFTFSYPVL